MIAIAIVHKELVLRAFDPAGAEAMGYPLTRLDLVLDVVIALAVVAGIRAMGTVLAVALIVTPAATARLVCRRIGPSMIVAALIGAIGGWVGLTIAWNASVEHDVRLAPGATVVVVLTAVFVVVAVVTGIGRRARRRARRMSRLADAFGSPLFRRAMLEAVLVGLIAGIVGVHVVLRRLPFFVTAMSHATFPGVVIASTLGLSMFLGGAAFGLVVVAAVLALGARRALDDTAVIAVVLAGSFAVGMMILSTRPSASKDLSAILVGSVLTVTRTDVLTTVAVGVVVLGVLAAVHKELVLGAFDPAGAQRRSATRSACSTACC